MVEDIAGFFNVKCLGIDVLAADISKPWTDGNFGIIEINAGPGVFMHLAPAYGGSIDVPGLFIKSHFHKNEYSRVPIIAGNNISQNFAKILNDKLHEIKPDIYFSSLTDEGIHFNGEYFFKNEKHDENVKIILRNPKTEIALFTHNFDDIFDYGILHEGADIIILNNPHYAEEKTLKEQLLPGGILIEVRDDEIIVSGEEPEHLSIPVENAEDKDAKLLEVIEPYLEELIVKYD